MVWLFGSRKKFRGPLLIIGDDVLGKGQGSPIADANPANLLAQFGASGRSQGQPHTLTWNQRLNPGTNLAGSRWANKHHNCGAGTCANKRCMSNANKNSDSVDPGLSLLGMDIYFVRSNCGYESRMGCEIKLTPLTLSFACATPLRLFGTRIRKGKRWRRRIRIRTRYE